MMKNFKNIMLFVMLVSGISLTTSCSSDDDGAPAGGLPAAVGTMAATINGVSFQSAQLTSTATKIETGGGLSTLNLRGGDFAGNTIVIGINNYEGPDNTYNIDSETITLNNVSYTQVDVTDIFNPVTTSWVAPYMDSGLAGTVTIATDDDNTITGTFQFTARLQDGTETITATGGTFNLEFTEF